MSFSPSPHVGFRQLACRSKAPNFTKLYLTLPYLIVEYFSTVLRTLLVNILKRLVLACIFGCDRLPIGQRRIDGEEEKKKRKGNKKNGVYVTATSKILYDAKDYLLWLQGRDRETKIPSGCGKVTYAC